MAERKLCNLHKRFIFTPCGLPSIYSVACFFAVDASPSPSPSSQSTSLVNPFLADVCATPFEVVEGRSVTSLNRDVVQRVATAVEELHSTPQKPLLLLTAPRAGYGKTHVLGRVAAAAETQSVAMPLVFRSDVEITWSGISHEALDALRVLPGRTPGWSRLREICTGIFASLVIDLIRAGRLPCANREQAIAVLGQDPARLFQETTQAKLIGDWLRKHFGQLRRPLAEAAGTIHGAGIMDAWVDALFAHAHHGSAATADTVLKLASGSREAYELWLRLTAHWRPAVLFVDHLDGFYRMERSGLRIATMLLDLAAIEGVHVVLSMNQDVWQATFAHHLPSAVEDRLTASQFLLRGLSAQDATALVALRMQGSGISADKVQSFTRFLGITRYFEGRPIGSVSARAFLRHAAQQWQNYHEMCARGEDPNARLADEPVPAEPPSPQSDPLPDVPEAIAEAPASSLFAGEDIAFMRKTASGLAEPEHAMVNTPFSIAAENLSAPPAPSVMHPTSPFAPAPEKPATAPLPNGQLIPAAAQFQPVQPFQPAVEALAQPNSPGALDRLREMIERLRNQPAPTTAPLVPPDPTSAAVTPVAQRLASVMAEGTSDPLLERFRQTRLALAAEAANAPLDREKLASLIRLAGKRFTLVKYDTVDLPGMPGKSAPRWTLHDQEIIFGLGEFTDRSYWRVLAQFALGRIAAISDPSVKFKLAVLKCDRDGAAWDALQANPEIIPEPVRLRIDPIHLDARSIASLYGMQRLIADAENGSLQVTPSQVMAVLARELDFFWKRVTRPLP